MVKHLVIWRLRDSERGVVEPELERAVLDAIAAMKAEIAGLRTAELGVNRCLTDDAADLALYTEFDSWSALQAYDAHPLHQELKRLIGPVRIERRVVDYEVS
jgi:hypothetical protein